MNCKILIAAAALLATQSFAIIGIGAHYNPGFGTTLKAGEKGPVSDGISFSHEGADGMMQGSEIPLEIELGGTPFGMANPKFVTMNGDISITYPITTLPIIRPYIGGGLTIFANSFVLNHPFVASLIDDPTIAGMIQDAVASGADPALAQQQADKFQEAGEALKKRVQDQAMDEGVKTSIGGHALIGVRAKLPIIPIAAYFNTKFYFGGDYPEEIDPGIVTLELGLGFAI